MSEEIKRYKRRLLKNIFLSGLIVFLILFGLDRGIKYYDKFFPKKQESAKESSIRSFLTPRQEADYRRMAHKTLYPYIMFVIEPDFRSATINTNSLGFRAPEITKKDKNTTRIFVVGGSAAMGYGATSDNAVFTKLLETRLNSSSSGKKYEVINAALSGAISIQEFIIIILKIMDLEPDAVIVLDGYNDMRAPVTQDRRTGFPFEFHELEKNLNISVTKAFIRKRLMNYRPTKKILEFLERKKAEGSRAGREYLPSPEAVAFYERTLDQISHFLKSYGVKPVFAFQPAIYDKTPKTALEKRIIASDPEGLTKTMTEMLEKGKRAMRAATRKNNDVFIDCTEIFNGRDGDIFMDTVHFNDRGHEILADFLYEKLKNTNFTSGAERQM